MRTPEEIDLARAFLKDYAARLGVAIATTDLPSPAEGDYDFQRAFGRLRNQYHVWRGVNVLLWSFEDHDQPLELARELARTLKEPEVSYCEADSKDGHWVTADLTAMLLEWVLGANSRSWEYTLAPTTNWSRY